MFKAVFWADLAGSMGRWDWGDMAPALRTGFWELAQTIIRCALLSAILARLAHDKLWTPVSHCRRCIAIFEFKKPQFTDRAWLSCYSGSTIKSQTIQKAQVQSPNRTRLSPKSTRHVHARLTEGVPQPTSPILMSLFISIERVFIESLWVMVGGFRHMIPWEQVLGSRRMM